MKNKTRILIVDDDEGMNETLSDILSEKGFDVSVTNDGYIAIEMVKKSPFDFALMDIKMPGINGVETFKKVHEIEPDIKVIMMTAYSVENLINEALEYGAFDVIHKPIDIEQIIATIKKAKGKIFGVQHP
ncbi:MAG: response regulator [Candidatus Cloacimonadota bacterium]|nr:response regulator [Candidatus Cloacimonadota bacterium]